MSGNQEQKKTEREKVKIEQQTQKSIWPFFESFFKTGKLDISNLPADEQRSAVNVFLLHADNFSVEQQTQILEHFTQLNVIEDHKAKQLVEQLPRKNQEQLALFIAQTLKPRTYVRTFHACWPAVKYDQRAHLIKYTTKQEPEKAILVAPFYDISKTKIITKPAWQKSDYAGMSPDVIRDQEMEIKDIGYKKRIRKKESAEDVFYARRQRERLRQSESLLLLQKNFDTFNHAKQLLDTLIEHYGEILRASDVEYSHTELMQERARITEVVKHYKQRNTSFLIPYLPRFVDLNIVSEEEAREWFNIHKDSYTLTPRVSFFATEKETSERNDILKRYREKSKKEYGEPDYSSTLNYQMELITQKGKTRGADHMFSKPEAFERFATRDQIMTMLESISMGGHEIMSQAKALNLTAQESARLSNVLEAEGHSLFGSADLSDITDFLQHANEQGFAPRAERLVMRTNLGQNLAQGYSLFSNYYLVRNLEKILPHFSEANQKKIIDNVSTFAPQLWLLNPDLAFNRHDVDFEKIIRHVGTQDTWRYFDRYFHLKAAAKRVAPDLKTTKRWQQKVRESAIPVFQRSPWNLISNHGIAVDALGEQRVHQMIMHQLQVDKRFEVISGIAKSDSKNAKPYKRIVKDIFLQDPDLIAQMIDEYDGNWIILAKMLGEQPVFDTLHTKKNCLVLGEILDAWQSEYAHALLKNPSELRRVIKLLTAQNNALLLVKLYKKVDEAQEERENETKKTSDRIKKDLDDLANSAVELLKKNPDLIFEADIARIPTLAEKLTNEGSAHFATYASTHPDILTDSYANVATQKLFSSPEEVSDLIIKHIKQLIPLWSGTTPEYDSYEFSPEQRKELGRLDPYYILEGSNSSQLSKDYYEMILDRAADYELFWVYEKKLKKIAKEQNHAFGPRLDIEHYEPHPAFVQMINNLALSANHPALEHLSPFIKNLDEDKRLELITAMALDAQFVDLSDTLLEDDLDINDVDSVIALLHGRAGKNIAERLGIEADEKMSADNLPTGALEPLLTYMKSIQGNAQMTATMKQTVRHLMSGSHKAWQQWDTEQIPTTQEEMEKALASLKEKRLIPKKITVEQYQSWHSPIEMDFEETLQTEERDVQLSINAILNQAVADQHIQQDELKMNRSANRGAHDALFMPIIDLNKRIDQLKAEFPGLEKNRKQIKKNQNIPESIKEEFFEISKQSGEYVRENKEEIEHAQAWLYLSYLPHVTLKDIQRGGITIGRKLVRFSTIFGSGERPGIISKVLQEQHPDFMHDIARIQSTIIKVKDQIFGDQRVSKQKLHLTDEYNPERAIKIGAEPVSSCQHYDGSSLCYGLLSNLTDPNVRIIQLYNESGIITGRSILRLLENDKGGPQLFMERIYSVNRHHKVDEAMVRFAQKKAQEMGVHLYTTENQGIEMLEEGHSANLSQHNSKNPVIYSDAGGGTKREGKMEIHNAIRVG